MIFDELYQIALAKDIDGLKRALVSKIPIGNQSIVDKLFNKNIGLVCISIDELLPGKPYRSVAAQLVIDGKKDAAEFLLSQGANKDYVIMAAAMTDDHDYVEDLLKRGAKMDFAVMGYAMMGDENIEYLEALIKRGASANYAVRGAAMGGHNLFATILMGSHQGHINFAAMGAAQGGFPQYANTALKKGADPGYVVTGARLGGYITKSIESQQCYLSQFSLDVLPRLLKVFREHVDPHVNSSNPEDIIIARDTKQRIHAIARQIHLHKLNYYQALLRINRNSQPVLQLLTLLIMKNRASIKSPITSLLLELWFKVFRLVMPRLPVEFSDDDFIDLGFAVGRSYILNQLTSAQVASEADKTKADGFCNTVSQTKNKIELIDLLNESLIGGEVIQNKKKVKLALPVQYHPTVGFWLKTMKGEAVAEQKVSENLPDAFGVDPLFQRG